LLLLVTLAIGNKVRFDGHKVLRFKVHNSTEAAALRNFVEINHLDVWAQHQGKEKGVIGEVDIRLGSIQSQSLPRLGLDYSVFIPNVQTLVNEESDRQESTAAPEFFSKYRTYQEHVANLQSLVTQYPNLVTLVNLGTTVESRTIWGVVITSKVQQSKPGIFLNGGQHAREWISPATVAYIAYSLLNGYGNDSSITKLVDSIEWTIVPIVNADGYEYTFGKDRLWRKNRRVNKGSSCVGVDTNRNWGFKFNTGGSSDNPCDEDYHGPSAFTEPENTALATYIQSHTNIAGYIDFHSYSQLWMTPWGYTSALPKDDKIQKQCGNACAKALQNVNGIRYDVGNVANIIYVASGGSNDWTYGAQNIVHSYAVELRDTGAYGFVLPANQIVPSGDETFAAVKVLGDCVLG